MYRFEASSISGFVQQLAVSYLAHGYWFYVTGQVPERKDPGEVDRKLLEKYRPDISKWARARRKKGGLANIHYLRFERFFVLIASKGAHAFFQGEPHFKDIREEPIRFRGYSIGLKPGVDRRLHPSVRIHPENYRGLRAHLLSLATHRSAEALAREFLLLPFEPYAPVCRQLLNLHRGVNRAREAAGLALVPKTCVRLWRRPVKPFEITGSG